MHGHRTGYLSMLPRLTELALLELDLSTLFQHIRALVDITKLLRLTIFHCQGVTNFLSDIETQVGGKSVALQHFSIESPQEVAESIKQRSLDAAEKCLQAMIHAETLQSLHTSWNVHSLLDPAFAEAFPTSQHMRSLSIHEGTNDSEYEHEMVLDISHLRETFQACPKLRSFGVRIPERFLLHQEPGEHSIMYDEFMEALQDLPHLRVLHLRQRNYLCSGLPTPAEDNPRNRLALTFKTHRWANVFFEHLHSRKWSLKLTALVIRCYLEKNANASNGYTYSSQHCFVKGLQVDAYGRTAAVAVPISRATLRKIEPDSDILDFDPECHWIGGRIGRLNRF
ncbi:hypothetical protein BKA66DRAFT_478120 [Pyrenochaeta sp. MPI-SDFR-AT-0127]|nr:hypothetical protein BKA66DRAFT_478120 [Pyrenochaeta sp. MPI-SDFR-AT-0127]